MWGRLECILKPTLKNNFYTAFATLTYIDSDRAGSGLVTQ